jgi:hypothetical protein
VLRSVKSLAPAIIDSLAAQRARFEAMASSTNECSPVQLGAKGTE